MQVPSQLRGRFDADDIPTPVFALVGASAEFRRKAAAAPATALRTKDRYVTTLLQLGFETRERFESLPGQLDSRVIDLRDGADRQYRKWTADGARALAQWQAERVLNDRADQLTRSVTPTVARATVSARRGAASPTGQRVGNASRRAKASATKAWQETVAAVDESGEQRFGGSAQRKAEQR